MVYIYFLIDDKGDIVYIGRSRTPKGRYCQQHWDKRFSTIKTWAFLELEQAKRAERSLVLRHRPIYNKHFNPYYSQEFADEHRRGDPVLWRRYMRRLAKQRQRQERLEREELRRMRAAEAAELRLDERRKRPPPPPEALEWTSPKPKAVTEFTNTSVTARDIRDHEE